MPKTFRLIFNKLISNPKNILLIDGLGALLTAFLLGTILTRLEEYFGMPSKVLYSLSIIACVYAVYSIYCHFFVDGDWRPFVRVIAIANLVYCCITVGIVIVFYQALTILGWVYFLGEILIIVGLVCIEVWAISKSNDVNVSECRS
jgi:hypothetical protein